jgi:hypothetical protein
VLKRVAWFLGALVVLTIAASSLITGITLVSAFGSQGRVSTDVAALNGEGAALVSDGLRIQGGSSVQSSLGTLTLGVTNPGGKPLFIGVASDDPLFTYLQGVPYEVVSHISAGHATIRPVPGSQTPKPPNEQGFWSLKAEGVDPTIDLPVNGDLGKSRIVVMNPDGSKPVNATLRAGVYSPVAYKYGLGSSIVGALLLIPGIWMLTRAFKRRADPAPAPASGVPVTTVAELPPPPAGPIIAAPPVGPMIVGGNDVIPPNLPPAPPIVH